MTLPADTLSVTLDGLDLLTTQANGSRISLEEFDGWGSPTTTLSPIQRPGSDGAWAGDSHLTARDITLAGLIVGPDCATTRATFDALTAACSLTDVDLTVNEGGLTRTVSVRRSSSVLHRWEAPEIVRWSLQMVALDPRKVSTALTGSTGLPVATGGWSIPWTIPWSIPSTVVAGHVSLTNVGNIAGRMLLRIDGPVVAPVVTHVSSGATLTFASSMTLAEGEWVDVDMEAKTVLANGTASRNGWVTSRGWFNFDPGVNLIAFSAATATDALLTVTAYPSYA
ncbi:MAG: phage tail family protein [Sphaerochaeta sp.]|nr:phage tail family protein [Sphaerochaeta sp.]